MLQVRLFHKAYDNMMSINPYDIKLCIFCLLYNIEHDVQYNTDLSQAPNQQSPYIIDGDVILGDSEKIIAYLVKKYNIEAELTHSEDDLVKIRRINDILAQQLFDIIYFSRFIDEMGWQHVKQDFFTMFPQAEREAKANAIRQEFTGRLLKKGYGNLTVDEVYQRADEFFAELNQMLGKQYFFLTDTPHAIDAAVFGFFQSILEGPVETGLKSALQKYPQLIDFYYNMFPSIRPASTNHHRL